jgi:hypothetical protein
MTIRHWFVAVFLTAYWALVAQALLHLLHKDFSAAADWVLAFCAWQAR